MKFKASAQEIFADWNYIGEKLNVQSILHLQSDMNVKTVFLRFWSFQKRKKAIFYFFRVQTQGVLNVSILCGRFLFLQHNIQTLEFQRFIFFSWNISKREENDTHPTPNKLMMMIIIFRKNLF